MFRIVFLPIWISLVAAGQTQPNPDLTVIAHRRIPETYCELVERGTLHLADAGIVLNLGDSKQGFFPSAFSYSLGFLEYDPYELSSDDRENTYYAARNAGFDLRTGRPASTPVLPNVQLAKDMPAAGCGTVESGREVLAAQPVPNRIYNPSAKDIGPPQRNREVAPQYTERARRNRVEGDVVLTLILKEDGVQTYIFVSRSLDPDLDKSAIEAVRKWQFSPATKDGQAVASIVNVDVHFGLYYNVR